jgi:hypothetical protein
VQVTARLCALIQTGALAASSVADITNAPRLTMSNDYLFPDLWVLTTVAPERQRKPRLEPSHVAESSPAGVSAKRQSALRAALRAIARSSLVLTPSTRGLFSDDH